MVEKGPRIVIVDNDLESQRTTENLLRLAVKDQEADFVTVFHHEDVFPTDQESTPNPDLLVVNVDSFPEESWSWIKELTAEASPHHSVPILVVSNTVNPDVMAQAEEQGIAAIQQPFMPQQFPEFRRSVEELLSDQV